MIGDLNRQAKVFLLCLGVPWLIIGLAALLLGVVGVLIWFGVIETVHDG